MSDHLSADSRDWNNRASPWPFACDCDGAIIYVPEGSLGELRRYCATCYSASQRKTLKQRLQEIVDDLPHV